MTALVLLSLIASTIWSALQPDSLFTGKLALASLSLLLMLAGQLLPGLKPQAALAFRTPWAMRSPKTWLATHRFAGEVWFWGGVFAFASCFLAWQTALAAMLGALTASFVSPLIFSYWFYQRFGR